MRASPIWRQTQYWGADAIVDTGSVEPAPNALPEVRVHGLHLPGIAEPIQRPAQSRCVMPSSSEKTPSCHWERVDSPQLEGRARTVPVWICEYPYRTMRATKPSDEDCEDCPLKTCAAEYRKPQMLKVDSRTAIAPLRRLHA